MPEDHKTETNPTGTVKQCTSTYIHGPHEWQEEFGALFDVYCPGNTGKDPKKDPARSMHFEEQAPEPSKQLSFPAKVYPAESPLEKDLGHLLNKHSAENASGTPDFILAMYLKSQLDLFNKTIRDRAVWRGESVELPALQHLRQESEQVEKTFEQIKRLIELGVVHVDGKFEETDLYRTLMDSGDKTVPLVMYTDGRRNEIGEAKVNVRSGEIRVTGTLDSSLTRLFSDPGAVYSVADGYDNPPHLDEPKDAPSSPTSPFERYQKDGLSQ